MQVVLNVLSVEQAGCYNLRVSMSLVSVALADVSLVTQECGTWSCCRFPKRKTFYGIAHCFLTP